MKVKVLIALVISVALIGTNTTYARYSGGTGEPNNPYRIATPNDLNDIGNHVEDFNKCFVMVNDINLADYTGTQFNIIGNDLEPFTGVFDGNGWTVSNFSYGVSEASWIGLFGYVHGNNAVIRNLVMVEPDVNEPFDMCIGCLVGALGEGVISNCQILNGTVHSEMTAGLLVGYSGEFGEIVDCDVTGYITGNEMVGGLAGVNQGQLVGCSATADVNGRYGAIGGLVGGNWDGTISHCYAKGSVKGIWAVGGLVGENVHATISNSFSKSNTEGDCAVGGLVGSNRNGTIYNSYAAGSVTGNDRIGGLLGQIDAGTYISSFWDSTVNPSLTGIGNGSYPNVIGKTTVEMQTESTFTDVGWDFVEVWGIGENQTYPYLRVYPAGDLNHDSRVDFLDFAIAADHWLEGTE